MKRLVKIHELIATRAAIDKLGARGISTKEAEQLPRNHHVTTRNTHETPIGAERYMLIGRTNGGRASHARDRAHLRPVNLADRYRLARDCQRAYNSQRASMTKDPWTDPDPQPGDFDPHLAMIDPNDVEAHEGNSSARLTIVLNVSGDDAERLERIAVRRGQGVDEVISHLLRDAERHAA
jgi:hypothetical protein